MLTKELLGKIPSNEKKLCYLLFLICGGTEEALKNLPTPYNETERVLFECCMDVTNESVEFPQAKLIEESNAKTVAELKNDLNAVINALKDGGLMKD